MMLYVSDRIVDLPINNTKQPSLPSPAVANAILYLSQTTTNYNYLQRTTYIKMQIVRNRASQQIHKYCMYSITTTIYSMSC